MRIDWVMPRAGFVMLVLALAVSVARAQSSRDEAWRWCARDSAAVTLTAQVAGCSWVIDSGQEAAVNQAIAFSNRCNAMQARGEQTSAIADCDAAVRLDPGNELALIGLGLARHDLGELAAAILDYTAALAINPRNSYALANRAIAQHRLGHTGPAQSDINAAIAAAAEDNGWPHAARGALAMLRDDVFAAGRDLTEALRREPQNANILQLRSPLRARRGDPARAQADATAARAINARAVQSVVDIFGPAIARR